MRDSDVWQSRFLRLESLPEAHPREGLGRSIRRGHGTTEATAGHRHNLELTCTGMVKIADTVKVADEVWIATALLHREHPDRSDFSIAEIRERVKRERVAGDVRGSVHVHVISHCVANRAPSPATHRLLVETGRSRRRLYRPGDPQHPQRRGKTRPVREEIPPRYRDLIDWYETEYAQQARRPDADPLLALRGSGRALWAEEHADEYVRRLRDGWA